MKVRARKIHKCAMCCGNIQKGEIHERIKMKIPKYNINDAQIGIEYYEYRQHTRNCYQVLLNNHNTKEILKNCNFGVHDPIVNTDPDSCDDSIYCSWCGRELISFDKPIAK